MLKKLTRKVFTLSMLIVALTAVSSTAAVPARAQSLTQSGEPTCWYCYCEGSYCYCIQVVCPEG
jgi:hypothetical protein